MGLNMKEKKAVIRETAARYQKAEKKGKTKILDEYIELTKYNRKYASWILRNWGKAVFIRIKGKLVKLVAGEIKNKKRRNKPKKYNHTVLKAIIKIWYIFDCMCGKRLAPALRSMLPILLKYDEIDVSDEVVEKLKTISPATIDRMLSGEKKKICFKSRSYTKPGTMLKHQIPIRTFSDWDEDKPGFLELDLVGHDGGNTRGDFAYTLNATDVNSGWTEMRAVKNRAQKWVFEALLDIKQSIPFKVLGIDSDNGSEFINAQLKRYCEAQSITFTRSRPYRKNDNCFVEQKNNSIIRNTVGYLRYDTEEELRIINELYNSLRLLVNFFYPSMKLIMKTRIGSKVKRKYDIPKTPCQRLLKSDSVSSSLKQKLKAQFDKLNPAALKRTVTKLQNRLIKLVKTKQTLMEFVI